MKYTAKFPNATVEKYFWKEYAKLPQGLQAEILEAIRSLEHDPRPFGQKLFKQLRPPLAVYAHAAQYRIRLGDYRILYDVDDQRKTVWIYVLRKRNEKTYR